MIVTSLSRNLRLKVDAKGRHCGEKKCFQASLSEWSGMFGPQTSPGQGDAGGGGWGVEGGGDRRGKEPHTEGGAAGGHQGRAAAGGAQGGGGGRQVFLSVLVNGL